MNAKEAVLLLQVQDFIDSNLHRPLPIATLCRHFHINRNSLQDQFREAVGCSIHAFMLRQRMHRAARRLRESDDPVKHVAWDCGYRNVRSFNKAFKNRWRLSPDRYRKKYQVPA
jgi:AraC-like DNA-binding protein